MKHVFRPQFELTGAEFSVISQLDVEINHLLLQWPVASWDAACVADWSGWCRKFFRT